MPSIDRMDLALSETGSLASLLPVAAELLNRPVACRTKHELRSNPQRAAGSLIRLTSFLFRGGGMHRDRDAQAGERREKSRIEARGE